MKVIRSSKKSIYFQILSLSAIAVLSGQVMLTGCRPGEVVEQQATHQSANQPIIVTVTLPPQAYFVKRIGGDRILVNTMIVQGVDPHTYEPKSEQMKYLAQSQLYLAIGGGLEDAWLPRLAGTNPRLQVTDTSQGIPKMAQTAHEEHETDSTHQQESTENHLDPHIWLSPRLVKQQAQTIYQAIAAIDPKNKDFYQANLKQFLKELEQLDSEIKTSLKGVKNREFMVFHPEWGYFADDYGLKMLSIQVEGKEPTASQLAEIMEEAKKHNIKVIFTQPEFSPQVAQVLAQQLGLKVIPISAMSEDWLNNLRQVSQTLAKNL